MAKKAYEFEGNIDFYYREYKKQFDKTTKYVKSRGGRVQEEYQENRLTRDEFAVEFISAIDSNPNVGAKKLVQDMAKEHVYDFSREQAYKAAEREAALTGVELTQQLINSYRMGYNKNIFEIAKHAYREFRKVLGSSTAARIKVSQEIWGSV